MAEESDTQKDPQIHLIGAKHCERMRSILKGKPEDIKDEDLESLETSIRFFSHFIKQLPECNILALEMCRFYLCLLKEGSREMELVGTNRVVAICTTIMVRQKEESLIRATGRILKDILVTLPKNVLKCIVQKYSKSLKCIFQKIYLVQTFYTQQIILDVFVFITKDLKELRYETIQNDQLMMKADKEVVQYVIRILDHYKDNNWLKTSEKFLKFYNNNLFPKSFILSLEGRIIELNDRPVKQAENILTSFNGRNLTVSMYIPQEFLTAKTNESMSQIKTQKNENLVYMEMECLSLHAEENAYKSKKFIDINIVVKQANTLDENENPVNCDKLKTIGLRLVDNEHDLNRFLAEFYEKYNLNDKMYSDMASLEDLESLMTFKTSASMIDDFKSYNLNYLMTQKTQQDESVRAPKKEPIHQKIVTVKSEGPKKLDVSCEPIVNVKAVDKPKSARSRIALKSDSSNLNINTRPKRKVSKINYKQKEDIYDEENISDHESIKTTYRDFKSQQQQKKIQQKRKPLEKYDEENYELPVEIIKQTTLTRTKTTTKINPAAKRQRRQAVLYETDNDYVEEKKTAKRGRKPKQVQAEGVKKSAIMKNNHLEAQKKYIPPEEKDKPEVNLNAKNERKLLMIKKETAKPDIEQQFQELINSSKASISADDQAQSVVNIPENKVPVVTTRTSLIPLKREEPANNKSTKSSMNEKSFKGLISSIPLPMQKVTKVDQVAPMKRKFAFGGLHNELTVSKKCKVEEWLQSSSTSFDPFDGMDDIFPFAAPKAAANKTTVIQQQVQKSQPKTQEKIKNHQKDVENDSYESDGIFANDDHQHYSSSSQESLDSDARKPNKVVTQVEFHNHTQRATTPGEIEPSQNAEGCDPADILYERCQIVADKLRRRKEKIENKERNALQMYDEQIDKYIEKYAHQLSATKNQLQHLINLRAQYDAEKSKLINEMSKQNKMTKELKQELKKREEIKDLHLEIRKKELFKLKNEALEKNQEILQEVWREYIDNLQTCFTNSIRKAYEI